MLFFCLFFLLFGVCRVYVSLEIRELKRLHILSFYLLGALKGYYQNLLFESLPFFVPEYQWVFILLESVIVKRDGKKIIKSVKEMKNDIKIYKKIKRKGKKMNGYYAQTIIFYQ